MPTAPTIVIYRISKSPWFEDIDLIDLKNGHPVEVGTEIDTKHPIVIDEMDSY